MTSRKLIWGTTAVLLITFALALTSLTQKSPTFDEQGFIVRGLGYLRGENRHMRVGHPLGLNALNSFLLASDEQVRLPLEHPSWQETSFHRPAELFLWEIGNDVERIMFLARVPTVWLGMLLAALVGRWALALSGRRWAALAALGLIAFDPNFLAHTRLATTDLGLAFGATLAGFTLWRYLKRPSWANVVLAGAGFGVLQNTKFTAGLFVPLFALVIGLAWIRRWRGNGRFPTMMSLQLLLGYPLAGFLTLWALNGFQVGTLPPDLPTFSQLSGLTLPLSHHLEQLLDIGGRLEIRTPTFLLGQNSDSGWWYYFPVAFILKTPLPTLLLLAAAVTLRLAHHLSPRGAIQPFTHFDLAALLIPAIGYFAFALTSEINLGYRHLLPILPFLIIFIAVTISGSNFTIPNSQFTIPLAWLLAITLWIHPHFLAYFNLLAGGPDNGWRALVDSNIDWGQDLVGLRDWMAENEVEHIWLSYFGEARPEYYGISYTGLDSWPPRLMNPEARPFYPHDPAPGIYAISASNLQGVHFADHDLFAWFRDEEPLAKIGYSIFLYQVEPYGEPAELALGGVHMDEIAPADFARLRTNDVTPHWFDPGQSLLIPQESPRWLALAPDTAVPISFQAVIDSWDRVGQAPTYTLYRIPPLPPDTAVPLATFSHETGTIALMDVAGIPETAVAGQTVTLRTGWLKAAPLQPVKIFLHLTDAGGDIVAQWDGLGAAWEGWRADDALWQQHQLTVPAATPPGVYRLWVGLYHPVTGTRWLTANGDRVLLAELEIGE